VGIEDYSQAIVCNKVIMRKREFDETDTWRLWKAVEETVTPTKHPARTAECFSFFEFEKRRYTSEQLLHMASCSYCQKTDWMFHHTPLTFKFLPLASPAVYQIESVVDKTHTLLL